MEAYLTVPRKPAAARAGRTYHDDDDDDDDDDDLGKMRRPLSQNVFTSPLALVYCRARPKSSM